MNLKYLNKFTALYSLFLYPCISSQQQQKVSSVGMIEIELRVVDWFLNWNLGY
jgi:hypothetical protein